MKDWFDSLQERERIFVTVAAVVVLLAVLYLFVWMPLDKSQKSMAASVDLWSQQLAELRPVIAKLQSQGTDGRPISTEPLVVIVDRTVRDFELASALQRTQPSGNLVRVEFENAAFDDLILWLGALNQRNGLRVQTANFSSTSSEKTGLVNSTLTLQR